MKIFVNNYYAEIEKLIERYEISKKVRRILDNSETLKTYWNIGKLIFETQGGEKRAKYGNEFKITHEGRNYFIDILLFNYNLNLFVVVELKNRELRQTDKGEVQIYMNLIDKYIKRVFHNKTVGIIISKEQYDFTVSYVSEENLITITYMIKNI